MSIKFNVLSNTVKTEKNGNSKVLPWKSTCNYIIVKSDDDFESYQTIAYGRTKQDSIIDSIEWAYREVIKLMKESNN
jgi:hypothetical protein